MEGYVGQQFVGIDLHRRRSVIVRMTAAGEVLETVQIVNDAARLGEVIARAGQDPEVVLESTYGWYWAVDALQAVGASVHLAHPLGVKAFEYRRHKDDVRDASDLADLLRMGRLPESWIAPPATRELRELVRHRAKLVALRSHCKAEVHAVLAKCGVQVLMSDLFGLGGTRLLDELVLPKPYAARIDSLRRVMGLLDFEIDIFAKLARGRLAKDPGFTAVQTIPGIGPVLAAVFVAEIGDVTRFASADKLTCWAGMTPKHHESDTKVRRGRITKQGSRLVRWAAVESVQRLPKTSHLGAFRDAVGARRGHNIAVVAAATGSWSTSTTPCVTTTSAGCKPDPQPHQQQRLREHPQNWSARGRAGHDPRNRPYRRHLAWSRLLIDPADPSTAHPIMPARAKG